MSLVVANYSRRNLVFDMFGYKDNSMLNKAWWQKIVFANQFISVKIKLQRIIVAWSRATSTCIMKLITGEFLLRNEHCLLFRGILYHVAVSTASETMDLMYEIFKREVYNFELTRLNYCSGQWFCPWIFWSLSFII